MEGNKRLELVGREALILYEDDGKNATCYGTIRKWDDGFIQIRTDVNVQIIPNRLILKIKLREGELDEFGVTLAKERTRKVREDGFKATVQ